MVSNLNILVLGFYNKNNIGDESYKYTFKKLFPSYNFTFVDKIERIDQYDCIILGGGNVIKDYYINQIKDIKIKKFIISAGLEKDFKDYNIFEGIYLRQKIDNFKYIPDFSFILEPNYDNGKKIINEYFKKENLINYNKKIAIIINSYITGNYYDSLSRDQITFNKFSNDLSKYIDSTNANFIFIPFGTSLPADDRISNGVIASKCKVNKNLLIFDRLNFQESLDVISSCDLTISTRLHSTIFSYISGVEFIDITHHSKNKKFLEDINYENNSIDFWNFDIDKLKYLTENLINKEKHNKYLKEKQELIEKKNEIHLYK